MDSLTSSLLPLLPLGVQTFSTIREKSMVYVDKTPYIQKLLSTFTRVFLSRPRRFGKSLFLSTLESYFKGEVSLFQGLLVSPKPNEVMPVIRLDLSSVMTGIPLEKELFDRVRLTASDFGITLQESSSAVALSSLIRALTAERRCVLLIDEYDKPITGSLTEEAETLERAVETLKNFYSVIKTEDSRIAFCFITGVSRLSKVSIFSGINNLEDISFQEEYAGLCGYTKEELLSAFSLHIEAFAQSRGRSIQELVDELEVQYNGYRFSEAPERVFNPISVLRALQYQKLRNYWFETATPTFLVNRIRQEKREPQHFDTIKGVTLTMEPTTVKTVSTADLMYQTGYLTIKAIDYEDDRASYTLGWPNREVKKAFYENLILEYATLPFEQPNVTALIRALKKRDFLTFFAHFNTLLATIPYSLFLTKESYYHSLLHMVLQVCGMVTHSEKLTSVGRIDIVCETDAHLFLFECQLDGSAEEALEQIETKRYAEQFRARRVVLIGVSFSSEERRVQEWKVKE